MAACRLTREWKLPRRMRCRVRAEKKVSTAFSHDPEVGVKWKVHRSWRASQACTKHLQEAVEGSLERLRLDHIDVYYLHIPDAAVSFDASVGALARLREQGKIRNVALSNVTLEHLHRAQKIVPIVAVQNRYGFADREWDYLLDHCEQHGIAFVPWAPLGQNRQANQILEEVANKLGATPLQVALAWLLRRSPVIAPIPGTSSVAHLEENVAAAALKLPDEDFKKLSDIPLTPANYRE